MNERSGRAWVCLLSAEEVEAEEEVEEVKDEVVSEREEEWPSLGLSFGAPEEVETEEEVEEVGMKW